MQKALTLLGDVRLQIIVLDSEKGTVAATTSVIQGACSGTIAGLGKISEKKLSFTPFVKIQDSDSCTINVEFDTAFKRGKIESQSCMFYHGAACDWDGQYPRAQTNYC